MRRPCGSGRPFAGRAWARVGQQARVLVSGRNAQRSLYCAVHLRSGRRITLGRVRQRQGDFQAFLRRLRHGRGAHGPISTWCSIILAATRQPPAYGWPKNSALS
jgi:hypothetical protein